MCETSALSPQDCNLVLYTASGAPIYYSGTYDQGTPPCQLTVSGSQSGGGSIRVSDSVHNALYVRPPSFGVLLDGGSNYTSQPYLQQYQVFNIDSGSAAQTATSPRLQQTTGRTLLPTANAILAYSSQAGQPGAEVLDTRTQAWAEAAAPSTDRLFLGLVTLFDGTALAVGGASGDQLTAQASCEVYSAVANSWSPTGSLSRPRFEVPTVAALRMRALALHVPKP